jgi:hypothetical protein
MVHTPEYSERFTVVVDGESWSRTTSLTEAAAADRVYVLDEISGHVIFGDGHHGQQPRSGAEVVVTYRAGGGHAGNVQVSVTTTWPPPSGRLMVAVGGSGVHIKAIDPGVEQFSGEKRVRYFSGQLLGAEDFETEQQYHLQAHYRHNKMLHGPGIVTGLEIEVSCANSTPFVIVRPGYAIDPGGRELILGSFVRLEIRDKAAPNYVELEHAEKRTDWLPTKDGSKPIASRIEDDVRVRLAIDSEKSMSLVIGRVVHGPSGWELDRTFQPLRPR